jgi:hypothetical protein
VATHFAEEIMTGTSHAVQVWGRRDNVQLGLAATTLALVAAQFALAGFGAFTMDKTPADNAYGAHMILGVVIGVMTWLILASTLASRTARKQPRTLWAAVTLAVLAVPVEPLLGEAGQRVPAVGALHALNGLAIFALTGWLVAQADRRRTAAGHGSAAGHGDLR